MSINHPISRRALIGAGAATLVARRAQAAFNPFGQQHAVYLNNYQIFDDGASHPASSVYGNIGATRTVYPFATAQTNEINWLSIQKAIYDAGTVNATLYLPYTANGFRMVNASSPADGSGTLRFGDYSDTFNAGAGGSIIFQGETSGASELGTALAWPVDLGQPADSSSFSATFSGAQMTVLTTPANPIIPGAFLYSGHPAQSDNTPWIIYQISGSTGEAGVYQLSNSNISTAGSYFASFACFCDPLGRRRAIQCGDYSDQFNGWYGRISQLSLIGPGVGASLGLSNTNMMGLGTADRTRLDELNIGYSPAPAGTTGFWAGINVQGGQTTWKNLRVGSCYYGAYWNFPGQEFGNMSLYNCDFSSNWRAGIGISPVYSLRSVDIIGGNRDSQPYGVYKEPWTAAKITAYGFGPDSFTDNSLFQDVVEINVQNENVGNAAYGDGIAPASLIGSITGITLTVTAGTAQVGQALQQHPGGPAILANTFIVAPIGAGTWQVNLSQTALAGAIDAVKVSQLIRTRMDPVQISWNTAGTYTIGGEPDVALIDILKFDGQFTPMVPFLLAPGIDCIFGMTGQSGAIAAVSPQPGLLIKGDLGVAINNCLSGASPPGRGGHGFFRTGGFITPGSVAVEVPDFWKAMPAPTFDSGFPGAPVAPLGSIVLRDIAAAGTPKLSAGNTVDDVFGIVILANVWPLCAYQGEVPVATGANSITAGQYVRTSSSGVGIAASGSADLTSKIIGVATGPSGGGFTPVRLQGLS